MENRPKIKLKLTPSDWFLETLALLSVLVLIVLPIYYHNLLPDRIPSHYDLAGKPDAYGNKSSLWVLSVVGILLYLFMTAVNRFTHLFNYPTDMTPEDAPRQYTMAARLVRLLKLIIGWAFAYLSFRSIYVALNKGGGLGWGFTLIFLGSIALVIISYLYGAIKAKKTAQKSSL